MTTTLYHGGPVLGLDDAADRHEALVTRNGRVAGIGTLDDMRTLAGRDASAVDLDGACLLPGLVDSHPHAMHFMAYRIGAVDLLDATDFADIVARIQARAAVTPKGEWIVCTPIGEAHYFIRRDHTDLAERRMPDRHVLDAAAPEHPVHVMAWAPRTPNTCAFNSLGLRRLGLGRQVPGQVCGVHLEKDDSGELTGVLRGTVNNYYNDDPYWHALAARLPQFPEGLWELAGAGGVQQYNAMGVTGLYEAHAMLPPHLDAYDNLAGSGLCTARVVMALELSGYAFATLSYSEAEVDALLALGARRVATDAQRVRTNGVTLSRGGPLSPGFLRMHDPYPGPDGKPTRGHTFLSADVERRVIAACLDQGLRLNMVLGGYRDVDEFLAHLAEQADAATVRAADWVLQHCYFTTPAHSAAFANHGFHVTTSASFVYGKADRVARDFPPPVAADFIAMRRFVDAGLNLGCGSDWGPDSPWRQMALGETREGAASGHQHDAARQGLTRLQSLHAWTRNGAGVMQWPGLGRLAVDGPADLCIVDRDPFAVDAGELADTQVLRTVLDGAAVFDTGALHGGPMALPTPIDDLVAAALAPPAP